MISNENIICFSTVDWDFLWQSQQEIMSMLTNYDNRVLFIDNTGVRVPSFKDLGRIKNRILNWRKGIAGIRKESDNLYVYSPIVFPFPYSRFFRFLNKTIILSIIRKWAHLMNFSNPLIWIYLPTGLTIDLIKDLDAKLTIYYSVDDYSHASLQAKKIKKSESRLIKDVDIVFTTSHKRYEEYIKHNENTYFFPDGLSRALAEEIGKPQVIPPELKNLKHPILGYIGGIHKWLDQDLIVYLAKTRPDFSIVMVGPIQCNISKLTSLKNIYFLGKKDHHVLTNYLKTFDLCLIPYLSTEYTNSSYPNKVIEYMAFGKPVVSTNLEEFKSLFHKEVYFAENKIKFMECIEKALNEDNDLLRQIRIKCAKDNSWEKRIEEMSKVIQDTINKKIMQKELKWKEILLSFQKKVRQKILKLLAFLLATYLLVFYTPFVWFLAKPLKISDLPEKSDSIVVFAGGVGESGQAGQGYEERVQHAVELYKKGYAKYMIFSSGYMYAFKEPMVMKALAVSRGVSEEAIILEDKAKNTYENIMFTKEILMDKGWNKILLVSSPYHMRRVSLVAKKVAPGIKIIYTPIPESRFYRHGPGPKGEIVWKQINLQQIKGLLHEYLGIAYYWWKGYVSQPKIEQELEDRDV